MEAPQISPAEREARQDFYNTIDRQSLTRCGRCWPGW